MFVDFFWGGVFGGGGLIKKYIFHFVGKRWKNTDFTDYIKARELTDVEKL